LARVTLYTRRNCPLCDEAARLLWRLAPEFGLEVEEVDIEGDATLLESYRDSIPVVALDGETLLSAPLPEARLRAVLARYRRAQRP
jgi:glutaredoxin